jgi:two-component system sensor histidine kinase HydH
MSQTMRTRFFFVSPWLLAAATGLLILIVVTFTLSTMQREKKLMTDAMLQKGATLMRVIGSGARSAYLADLRRGIWNTSSWDEYLERIITHLSEDPSVRFMMVVDDSGRIIAHTDRERIGTTDTQIAPFFKDLPREKTSRIAFKAGKLEGYGRIFLVSRPFMQLRPAMPSLHLQDKLCPAGERPPPGLLNNLKTLHLAGPDSGRMFRAVIGLDMKAYDKSLQRLRFQAIMLSLTMLLVGIGGWLSLAAVQGYRVSQKSLSDIQAFTGLLVSRLPVGIIATDQQGRVSNWNQAAEDMTSVPSRKALGQRVSTCLPTELQPFFGLVSGKAATKDVQDGEIKLVVDGRKKVLLCQRIDLRDPAGSFIGQVLLLSDISRVKDLESEMRENERLAAVGRMAAGVAHEVRNPLSSIKGLALLLKNKFSSASKEYETTSLLIQEVERMNRTISELLSFSRPAALDLQQVNIEELLSDTLQLVAADTASEHVKTSLDCAGDLPLLMVDRDRLSQVFINILLNGVQAMEQGGELQIVARMQPEGKQIELLFKDQGSGIQPEYLPQVFFPYFTTKTGGTGIGLAISQKIIADHGGTIRVESEPGKGTTVFVELPV